MQTSQDSISSNQSSNNNEAQAKDSLLPKNKSSNDDQPDDKKNDNDENQIKTTGKFDDGKCAICLNSPQVDKSFPPCEHTFCFECLDQWCNVKNDCPTCKMEIRSFHHNNGKDVKHVLPREENLPRPVIIIEAGNLFGIAQLFMSYSNAVNLLRRLEANRTELINRRVRRSNAWIESEIVVLTSEIEELRQVVNGPLRRLFRASRE